ncbi:HEAT repeat domain-containing protein [Coleofasciculus sp. H7-2]|uniref:HEAT repeat domain-containing protein n=1 Tax=Coleofasciculus sp. H7-2 TaxID=3351545 RepID=UPI00366FADD5
MNLKEVKNQFPEAAGEIEILESLGFASRSGNWIDTLDVEKAQTACWLVGRVGNDQDADALISILSGQRSELWMQAATSLSLIAIEKHLNSLLFILATSSNPVQRNSAVYALSFLSNCTENHEVIRTLTYIAANNAESPSVRSQALEGLGNQLSQKLSTNLYQRAVSVIIQALNSSEAEIRFWGCFAAGAVKIKEALPKLQVLAQTDNTIVAGWWSVGEEAEDSIALMDGGEPALRKPHNSPNP